MDFVEMLKDEVSNDSVNLISQKTGENQERTRTGIVAAIPAVLAGIMKNGSAQGVGFLNNLFPGQTAGRTGTPGSDLTDSDSLMDRGKSLIANLFGADTDSVADAVSDSSGISRQKSAGLLAMAAPVIMGAISRLMSSKGWSFTDLLGKLFENKSSIASSLPGTLGSTFGLASLNAPDFGSIDGPGRTPASQVPPIRNVHVKEPEKSGSGFLKWLIPLILIALVAWWLLGRNGSKNSANMTTDDSLARSADTSFTSAPAGMVAGSLNAAGDWVYDLGPTIHKKLPNGTEISVGQNSVENRLISFIEDDNRPVDKTTWFSFDRLYFETGKSTLKPESAEQLKNITAIMKAYPRVKIKLGGYTDSTGDAATNKRLSTDRAMTTMKELTAMGISADRMEAEGYGPEHPVGSNETAEGRSQNRRIDIRVTEK